MSNALSPQHVDVSGGHFSWLASSHGTDSGHSVTLDADAFSDFDDGIVPAGTVLTYTDQSAGRVGPRSGSDDTAAGYLLTPRNVSHGDAPGSMLTHGQVWTDRLPDESGYGPGVDSDLPGVTHF